MLLVKKNSNSQGNKQRWLLNGSESVDHLPPKQQFEINKPLVHHLLLQVCHHLSYHHLCHHYHLLRRAKTIFQCMVNPMNNRSVCILREISNWYFFLTAIQIFATESNLSCLLPFLLPQNSRKYILHIVISISFCWMEKTKSYQRLSGKKVITRSVTVVVLNNLWHQFDMSVYVIAFLSKFKKPFSSATYLWSI